MNARFEELFEQSRIGRGLGHDMEKFAQSIVREVLAVQEQFIAEGHNAWHLNEPTKNHFGISE